MRTLQSIRRKADATVSGIELILPEHFANFRRRRFIVDCLVDAGRLYYAAAAFADGRTAKKGRTITVTRVTAEARLASPATRMLKQVLLCVSRGANVISHGGDPGWESITFARTTKQFGSMVYHFLPSREIRRTGCRLLAARSSERYSCPAHHPELRSPSSSRHGRDRVRQNCPRPTLRRRA
jgi:hypothetical protein